MSGSSLRLAIAALLLAACGGSASETPFPQSPKEMTSEPVLRHPRPGSSGYAPPRRAPTE